MSKEPTGPTPEEEDQFPLDPDAEVIDWENTERVGGGPRVSFTPDQLDELFTACELTSEDSVSFVKRAALERIAEVLGERRTDAPAAGGS